MKPYEPITVQAFRLPNGGIGNMPDEVDVSTIDRYRQEVMLLQIALGVTPDGIIGPNTRTAAKAVFDSKH